MQTARPGIDACTYSCPACETNETVFSTQPETVQALVLARPQLQWSTHYKRLSSEEYLDKKLPTTWQGGFSITFITDSNQFHSDQDMQQLPVVLQLMSLAYFTK